MKLRAFLLFCLPLLLAFTANIATNFDGTKDSQFWAGNKSQGPPITPWEELAFGPVVTCETSDPDVNGDATVNTSALHTSTEACAIVTDCSSEDCSVSFDVVSVTGTNPFRGCGTFLSDTTDFTEDVVLAWQPGGVSNPRLKWLDNSVVQTPTEQSGSGATIPLTLGINYDWSEQKVQGLEWDGAEWDLYSERDVPITTAYKIGVFCVAGDDIPQTSLGTLENITHSTTLLTVGGSSAPPSDPTTDTPAFFDPTTAAGPIDGGRTTVNVSNNSELTTAITDAACGETVVMASGTYSANVTINASCPYTNPFIVKGTGVEDGTVATGKWITLGTRNIVTGITFDDAPSIECYGQGNKFIANWIKDYTTSKAMKTSDTSRTGLDLCEVAYNDFGPFAGSASSTHFSLKADVSSSSTTVPTNVWVLRNNFHGHKDGGSNDTDFIEPGNSGRSWEHTFDGGWYLQENRFSDYADCNRNVVDMKFSDTTFLRNTIDNACTVKLTIRIGSRYIVDGNFGGTIITSGQDNVVVCNNATLRIQAGETACNQAGPIGGKTQHDATCGAQIESNVGTLKIGHQPNADYDVTATNNTVRDHSGSIICSLESGTVGACGDGPIATPTYSCTAATPLDTSDVGPGALSLAPSAYKDARGL